MDGTPPGQRPVPAVRARDLREFVIAVGRCMERVDTVPVGQAILMDVPELYHQRFLLALLLTLVDTRGKKGVYIGFHRSNEFLRSLFTFYCRNPEALLLVDAGRGVQDEGATKVRFLSGFQVHDLFRGIDHRTEALVGETKAFVNLELQQFVVLDHLDSTAAYTSRGTLEQFVLTLTKATAAAKLRGMMVLDQDVDQDLFDMVQQRVGLVVSWQEIWPGPSAAAEAEAAVQAMAAPPR